jgi:hypothetical protein
MTLRKRRGQVTRRVEAPLCVDCARQLARRSGREERLLRLAWPAALITTALIAILLLAALPLDSQLLELIVAVTIGLVAGIIVWYALARRAAQAELPEKRAVAEAARIVDYTWRDMTLSFVRPDVAERVRELNAGVVGAAPVAEEAPVAGENPGIGEALSAGEAPGGELETSEGAPLAGEPSA